MIRILIALLFLGSLGHIKAAGNHFDAVKQKLLLNGSEIVDSVKRLPLASSRVNVKFVYAELLYQRLYAVDKLAVNGDSVSDALKKAVGQAKYRDQALDMMGAEGWELSAGIVREVTGGYEMLYYLKKKID